jgi:hypothetical protein
VTGETFPALSVRQPWAELIVSGRKPLELRSWQQSYRGRIWIHAGKHVDEALDARFDLCHPFRGGFIGSAELTSIELLDERRWELWRDLHHSSGPFELGMFAWVLAHPKRLAHPVPARGDLGLFSVPPEVLADLIAADRESGSGQ